MSLNLSVAQLLANLEQRIAFHRDKSALHARHMEHHREQHALHEAELEKAAQHHEALKALAGTIGDLIRPPIPPSPETDADLGKRPNVSKLALRIIQGKPDGETFGAASLAAEINARFRDRLRKPADPRTVSAALRRFCYNRRIRLVQKGRAFHGALYTKGAVSKV